MALLRGLTFVLFHLLASVLVVNVQADDNAGATLDAVLKGDSDLSTLWNFIESADLQGALNDTDATLTLFAPVNSAFDKLSGDVAEKLQDPKWILHLQNLLLLHVTGEVLQAEELSGKQLNMLNEEVVNVTGNATSSISLSSPYSDIKASVTESDLSASNGIVHKIDSVLLPKWVSTSATELASEYPEFSIFYELFNLTGLAIPPDESFTLLAPTNDAWESLPNDLLEFYRDPANKLRLMLLLGGHVLRTPYPPTSLTDGMKIPAVARNEITVTLKQEQDGETSIMFDDATVIGKDIAINGLIYGLDTVLLGSQNATKAPSAAPAAPSVPSAPTNFPPDGTNPPASAPTDSSNAFALQTMTGLLFTTASIVWIL